MIGFFSGKPRRPHPAAKSRRNIKRDKMPNPLHALFTATVADDRARMKELLKIEKARTAQREILEIFLGRGVSPTLQDATGKSILEWAMTQWIQHAVSGRVA